MLGIFAAIYENWSFDLPWVPNSRPGKPSAVSFEFFSCALAVETQGALMSGTILAKAWAISPANSGAKRVTCFNWCQELLARHDRAVLGVKGAQGECLSDRLIRRKWGPREKKKAGLSLPRDGDTWSHTSAKAAGSQGHFQCSGVMLPTQQTA